MSVESEDVDVQDVYRYRETGKFWLKAYFDEYHKGIAVDDTIEPLSLRHAQKVLSSEPHQQVAVAVLTMQQAKKQIEPNRIIQSELFSPRPSVSRTGCSGHSQARPSNTGNSSGVLGCLDHR